MEVFNKNQKLIGEKPLGYFVSPGASLAMMSY